MPKIGENRSSPEGVLAYDESIRAVSASSVFRAGIRLPGPPGEETTAQAKRTRTEICLDGGWGTTEIITWLLERGYPVTGEFKSTSRVRKLVQRITGWQPTSSPGREVAPVATPVAFVRPLAQYAVRTPSKDSKDGYYYAVVFSTHLDLPMTDVVSRYDGRAEVEADLKGDKRGLALAMIRKRQLAAQKLVVLLTQLAHNVLLWSRQWLAARAPRLLECGIVRLVQEVWAVPGRVKLGREQISSVRLRTLIRVRGTSAVASVHSFIQVRPWGFGAKIWQLNLG